MQDVFAAESRTAAAAAVEVLESHLDRLAERAGPSVDRTQPGGAPHPVAGYLRSRRALVAAFRERGLGAARAWLKDLAFMRTRPGAAGLFEPGRDCPAGAGGAVNAAAAADRVAGGAAAGAGDGIDGRGPRIWRTPGVTPSRPGETSPRTAGGPRGPSSRSGGLPAADIRAGIVLVAVLGLLLLALAAVDRTRRRDRRRTVCRISARLRVRGDAQPAEIVEIGPRSAKLRTEGRLRAGEFAALEIGDAAFGVRVAWVTPTFSGVSFRRRLDLSAEALSRLSARENPPTTGAHAGNGKVESVQGS